MAELFVLIHAPVLGPASWAPVAEELARRDHQVVVPSLTGFHRAHPDTELDVVTLFDAATALDAVRSSTIDASFRAVTTGTPVLRGAPVPRWARQLPGGISAARILDEPIQLVTGPRHELATARAVSPRQLAGHRIWMPGIVTGTEWAACYEALAAEFGLTIDATGPNFGIEPLLEAIAGSPALATFVGEQTRLHWPAEHDLRRIAVRGPVPVYPHSLIWRRDNPHPALATLRGHLTAAPPGPARAATWTPAWARPSA